MIVCENKNNENLSGGMFTGSTMSQSSLYSRRCNQTCVVVVTHEMVIISGGGDACLPSIQLYLQINFFFVGMMVSGNIMREKLRSGMKYSIEDGECIEKTYMKGVE